MPNLTAEELAFKTDHDAIRSYEDGWDGWDGPQWPIGTVQCSIRMDYLKRTHLSSNILAEAQWKDSSPNQKAADVMENIHPTKEDGRGFVQESSP